MSEENYFSKKYVDGIYIPSGLLVVGCLIVKREWVPYAVLLAAVLGGYKFYASSKYSMCPRGEWQNTFEIKANTIGRSQEDS
jgi:cytochrome-b5 reductase